MQVERYRCKADFFIRLAERPNSLVEGKEFDDLTDRMSCFGSSFREKNLERMKRFFEQLDIHQRFLQQERDVERDWNQVTSVCLTLQFPEKDSAIGMAQIDLIGRDKSFFKLDRFKAFIYAADSTLMADTKNAAFLMAHVPVHL